MAQVFDPAYLEIAIKAMLLLLVLGGCVAVFELIRYLRALRHGRELNHRLVVRRAQEEMGNDPRLAAPAPVPARPGILVRMVGRSIHTVGIIAILIVALAAFAVPFLGPWLEHQDDLERADAIVPLPGDPRRLARAAELYKQGYAPRVLLGKDVTGFNRIEAMQADAGDPATDFTGLQLRALERAGVPRESIDLADMGSGTAAAADAVRRQFGDRKARVIVVATGIHAMRARLAFEQALPRARVMVATVPDDGSDPWWSSHDSAVETIAEASRVAHLWLRGGDVSAAAPPPHTGAPPSPESTGSNPDAARP